MMFIVIEGPDAVGKATQARRLQERLERLGVDVEALSFPRYKTPLGSAILRHLRNEIVVTRNIEDRAGDGGWPSEAPEDAMIFQAMMVTDKYDAAPAIDAAIKRGAFVVCDRWWQSAVCYGAADGLPGDWLYRAHQRLPQADLNILIDIDVEEARRRTLERGRLDRYEKDPKLQDTVHRNYLALWGQPYTDLIKGVGLDVRSGTWAIVKGMARVEEVHERIWQLVVREQERRFRR